MSRKVAVNRVRAFVDKEGEFGNPTGIILDVEQKLSKEVRQAIATKLKYTDTVFINELDPVRISFFNPQQETKFAGDALISTAYFVNHVLGEERNLLVCKGGQIRTWNEGELTWIESSLEGTPVWNHQQYESPELIDNINPVEAAKFEHTMVWAWVDQERGIIRSRTFLSDWGTLEDQGNGSGSMQLAKMLGRSIEVHQGVGSIIYAEYLGENNAKIGGRVKVDSAIYI